MLTETDLRLLAKFVYNFAWKGIRSVAAFEKRQRNGEFFPDLMLIEACDFIEQNQEVYFNTGTNVVDGSGIGSPLLDLRIKMGELI